jgi:hypothetical protein
MSAIPALREGEAGGLPMQGQPELLLRPCLKQTNKKTTVTLVIMIKLTQSACFLPYQALLNASYALTLFILSVACEIHITAVLPTL